MLNLDEAIRHCEEVAERERLKGFEYNTNYNRDNEWGEKCYKCAEEHRQLAEWLKDYKRLKEKEKPEMVIYTADGYADGQLVYDMAECPNCGEMWHKWDNVDCWESPYCDVCGQALKWEVEE